MSKITNDSLTRSGTLDALYLQPACTHSNSGRQRVNRSFPVDYSAYHTSYSVKKRQQWDQV